MNSKKFGFKPTSSTRKMLEIAKHFGIFRGTTKLWDVRSRNAPLFPDLYSFDEEVG